MKGVNFVRCAYPLSLFRNSKGIVKLLPTGTKSWYDLSTETTYNDPELVPCGKCIACRLNHAQEWQARCIMEMQYHDDNCFITLTYTDDNMPRSDIKPELGTLRKSDIQKFFKRLRKKYPDNDIRIYYAGEYGEHTARPHFHAIIFGYFPQDAMFYRMDKGHTLYTSEELFNIWDNGFVIVGRANALTAGYVSRYVTSKLTGMLSYSTYIENGLVPPFQGSSRRPALGRRWYEDNKDIVLNFDFVSLPYDNGSKQFPIPQYFYYLLAQDFPEAEKAIKYRHSDTAAVVSEFEDIIYPDNPVDKMFLRDYYNNRQVNKRM